MRRAIHRDEAQLIQTAQEAAEQLKELFETDTVNVLRLDSSVAAIGRERSFAVGTQQL